MSRRVRGSICEQQKARVRSFPAYEANLRLQPELIIRGQELSAGSLADHAGRISGDPQAGEITPGMFGSDPTLLDEFDYTLQNFTSELGF